MSSEANSAQPEMKEFVMQTALHHINSATPLSASKPEHGSRDPKCNAATDFRTRAAAVVKSVQTMREIGLTRVALCCECVMEHHDSVFESSAAWHLCAISGLMSNRGILISHTNGFQHYQHHTHTLYVDTRYEQFVYALWLVHNAGVVELSRLDELCVKLGLERTELTPELLQQHDFADPTTCSTYSAALLYVERVLANALQPRVNMTCKKPRHSPMAVAFVNDLRMHIQPRTCLWHADDGKRALA